MNEVFNENLSLPDSKAELLERIDREWKALERVVAHVGQEEIRVPASSNWSVKDHLAHLAEWERYLRLHHIQGLPAYEVLGVEQSVYAASDEDGLNAILHERNQDRSMAEVSSAFHASHAQVMQVLREMTYDEMLRQRHPGDEQARPVLVWIAANTYEHYKEHRESIERLVQP